jgi:hypothetical protein
MDAAHSGVRKRLITSEQKNPTSTVLHADQGGVRRTTPEHQANVAEFFTRFNRPVDFAQEEGADNDARQSSAVGWLCLAYGGFVLMLALIPNPLIGRLAFIGCGGIVLLIGAILLRSSRSAPKDGA